MSLILEPMSVEDIEEIIEFETRRIPDVPSNMEEAINRDILIWNSKWRKESLEFYIRSGWAFMVRENSYPKGDGKTNLVGYFLAQPLLFFESQTQNLWVEHIQYSSLKSRDELCQQIIKLAKDKQIHTVFFPNQGSIANGIQQYRPKTWTPPVFVLSPHQSM